MQFNDTTNLSGLIQMCEKNTNLGYGYISDDATKLKEFTNNINIAQNKIWHTIFESTGCWEYDDSNATDLPQATANLVSGTSKYALPSDALVIKRVEMKDSSGNWFVLTPLIRDEIKVAIDEYRVADGLPTSYRLLGDTIEIFPASNYTSTSGLKVYFDRGSVQFTSTDTTKTPGYASPYHYLSGIGGALEWLKVNLPNDATTTRLENDFILGLQQLSKFYNKRFPAKKKVMRRAYQTYK